MKICLVAVILVGIAAVPAFPQKYKLPEVAARGGAETMYPEYQQKMKANTK